MRGDKQGKGIAQVVTQPTSVESREPEEDQEVLGYFSRVFSPMLKTTECLLQWNVVWRKGWLKSDSGCARDLREVLW